MGIINVEGLGAVQIEGDVPTYEEQEIIKQNFTKIQEDQSSGKRAEDASNSFFTPQNIARFGLELGFGVAGALAAVPTGGLSLTALAALRGGMLARPFITQLAKSSFGAAAGSGFGAGTAQIIDPKDDVVREVMRGAMEGAVGEAIGGPLAIKGGQYLSKYLGNKTPQQFAKGIDEAGQAEAALEVRGKRLVDPITGAVEAETAISKQADEILADPIRYATKGLEKGSQEYNIAIRDSVPKLIKAANEAKKGLTLGVKADNRALDIIENIGEKSLIGSGQLVERKAALRLVSNTAVDDMVDLFSKGLEKDDVGNVFFSTLSKSDDLFKMASKKYYKAVDNAVSGAGLEKTKLVPMKSIKVEALTQKNQFGLKNSTFNTIEKEIQNKAPYLTFTAANDLRGSLLSAARKAKISGDGELYGALNKIRETIDGTLESKALAIPDTLRQSLDKANTFYRQGKDVFNKGMVRNILKTKPEAIDGIFDSIVKAGDKPTVVAKTVKEIDTLTQLKDPTGKALLSTAEANTLKDTLKGQFLKNLSGAATEADPVYGALYSADKFASYLNKFRLTKDKIFTKGELKSLEGVQKQLAFAQGALSRGATPGGIFIQLKQAGAAGALLGFGGPGLLAGGLTGAAGAILLGPLVLNKMLLNPKISSLLFKEYGKKELGKMTPGKAGAVYRQLLGRMADENIINSDQLLYHTEQSKKSEDALNKAGVKTSRDLRITPTKPTSNITNMAPVKTQVTQPRGGNILNIQPQSRSRSLPTTPQSTPKPVSGGITNIPQERINQYTNLFGRI